MSEIFYIILHSKVFIHGDTLAISGSEFNGVDINNLNSTTPEITTIYV